MDEKGKTKTASRILMRKLLGKWSLEGLRRKWVDIIKTDVK
jgi:hypothetical protein